MAIPLLLIAGAAIAAGAAAAAAASKTGKSNFQAQTFDQHPKYNENAFHYGGQKGVSQQRAGDYRREAMAAQDRRAPTTDYSNADWWESHNAADRDAQGATADLMWKRANGLVPSISRMSGDRAMQQAEASQLSQAASARGAGALALAQQNANANIAGAQQNIAAQTQIAEAQERLAAEQAAFGAFSGMRGQDMQSMAQRAQMAQFLTQSELQQRGLNDQYSLGLYGYENFVNQAELQAQLQQQALLQASHAGTDALRANVSLANSAQDWKYVQMGVGGAQGAMSAANMGSGGGAVGKTSASLGVEAPAAPATMAGAMPQQQIGQVGQPLMRQPAPQAYATMGLQQAAVAPRVSQVAQPMSLGGPATPMYGGLTGFSPQPVAQRPAPVAAMALAHRQPPPQPQALTAPASGLRAAQPGAAVAAPAQRRVIPVQRQQDPRRLGLMRAA